MVILLGCLGNHRSAYGAVASFLLLLVRRNFVSCYPFVKRFCIIDKSTKNDKFVLNMGAECDIKRGVLLLWNYFRKDGVGCKRT